MTRVVPVVVFLHPGEPARQLRLGTERATYMAVTYISCHLARLNALDYLESTNIVARILLPCMDAPDDRRGEVVAKSIEGLMTLEANVHKQHKYAGFISMYAGLDDQGRVELMERTTRAPWSRNMKSWFDEAEEKREARGIASGKAQMVLRTLTRRKLRPTAAQKKRVLSCTDDAQIEAWFDRALTATKAADVFAESRVRRPRH